MKQSLQLRIGQSLTMTPQLQQAIKLLQLSTLELQTEIQDALESNPMLEVEETHLKTPVLRQTASRLKKRAQKAKKQLKQPIRAQNSIPKPTTFQMICLLIRHGKIFTTSLPFQTQPAQYLPTNVTSLKTRALRMTA